MNTKKRFIEAVELINSITIALMMLAALKIVLNGIGDNYAIIVFGGILTDSAIEKIVRSLSIAVPMAIGSWAVHLIVRIWCGSQRKLEEERS